MSHLDLLLIDLTQERSSKSKYSLIRNDKFPPLNKVSHTATRVIVRHPGPST